MTRGSVAANPMAVEKVWPELVVPAFAAKLASTRASAIGQIPLARSVSVILAASTMFCITIGGMDCACGSVREARHFNACWICAISWRGFVIGKV
ncbi:hypothetical protein GCM10011517_19810 [Actibacterium pelagium]|uniref:Uncharacterized protein n=1 Tax=Actibacterium pelagium TaxID=2029103 RepID=A0A917AGS4_9RHOB|nr:hypothetical protein GCM10011517_19810 [Actibacterium pelagium]